MCDLSAVQSVQGDEHTLRERLHESCCPEFDRLARNSVSTSHSRTMFSTTGKRSVRTRGTARLSIAGVFRRTAKQTSWRRWRLLVDGRTQLFCVSPSQLASTDARNNPRLTHRDHVADAPASPPTNSGSPADKAYTLTSLHPKLVGPGHPLLSQLTDAAIQQMFSSLRLSPMARIASRRRGSPPSGPQACGLHRGGGQARASQRSTGPCGSALPDRPR